MKQVRVDCQTRRRPHNSTSCRLCLETAGFLGQHRCIPRRQKATPSHTSGKRGCLRSAGPHSYRTLIVCHVPCVPPPTRVSLLFLLPLSPPLLLFVVFVLASGFGIPAPGFGLRFRPSRSRDGVSRIGDQVSGFGVRGLTFADLSSLEHRKPSLLVVTVPEIGPPSEVPGTTRYLPPGYLAPAKDGSMGT
eukprot:1326180-Rhodomonas_salina.1